jgi:Family of unknown function (DUF6152)
MLVKNGAKGIGGIRIASLCFLVLMSAAWGEAGGRVPASGKSGGLAVAEDALTFPAGGLPHHGTAGYDLEKMVTLNGTATSFDWANPHCLLHMDVKGSDGEVERWTIEMASPTALSRRGWAKDSIKPGDQVSIDIHPAKNEIYLGISSSSSYILKAVVNGKALPARQKSRPKGTR